MKNKTVFRLFAAILTMAMLTGNAAMTMASSVEQRTEISEDTLITAEKAGEYILKAADDYQEGITLEEIMERIPEGNLTRGQAFLLLWRAFGELPAPKGNNEQLMDTNVSFKDVPEELKEAVNGLIKGAF